jgi:hypothetical protein
MTQERERQSSRLAIAQGERHQLTEAELAQVAGGTEGPGSPTDGTSKASPQLF